MLVAFCFGPHVFATIAVGSDTVLELEAFFGVEEMLIGRQLVKVRIVPQPLH